MQQLRPQLAKQVGRRVSSARRAGWLPCYDCAADSGGPTGCLAACLPAEIRSSRVQFQFAPSSPLLCGRPGTDGRTDGRADKRSLGATTGCRWLAARKWAAVNSQPESSPFNVELSLSRLPRAPSGRPASQPVSAAQRAPPAARHATPEAGRSNYLNSNISQRKSGAFCWLLLLLLLRRRRRRRRQQMAELWEEEEERRGRCGGGEHVTGRQLLAAAPLSAAPLLAAGPSHCVGGGGGGGGGGRSSGGAVSAAKNPPPLAPTSPPESPAAAKRAAGAAPARGRPKPKFRPTEQAGRSRAKELAVWLAEY